MQTTQIAASGGAVRPRRFIEWTSLRYYLLWAYEGDVLRKARIGTYTDSNTSCWLMKAGEVELQSGRDAVTVRAGQWAFVASPTRHQHFSRNAKILSLHFHLGWPDGEQLVERNRTLILEAKQFPELESTGRPIVDHVQKAFPRAKAFLPAEPSRLDAYLAAQALLPLWMTAYLRALARLGCAPRRLQVIDDRLLQGVAILDHHNLAIPFRESELIRRIGLSRARFDALFIAAYGVTPRRYLEQRRLRAAEELLRNRSLRVKEVALGLGFRHVSHFSLWFKRLTGRSPSDFQGG
jgi:AraC-like DNA-binding protein